jgi:drug/metabolite transporter (DMT)-like permease
MGGAVLLVLARSRGASGGSLAGDVLVLLSAVFASTGYVAGARLNTTGYPAQAATYWGATLASVVVAPALLWLLPPADLAAVSASAWLGLAYLAFGVTIFGYVFWYWALGHGDIARVGMLMFLQPVFGVLLAAVVLGDPLSLTLLAAGAVILTGVVIATRAR